MRIHESERSQRSTKPDSRRSLEETPGARHRRILLKIQVLTSHERKRESNVRRETRETSTQFCPSDISDQSHIEPARVAALSRFVWVQKKVSVFVCFRSFELSRPGLSSQDKEASNARATIRVAFCDVLVSAVIRKSHNKFHPKSRLARIFSITLSSGLERENDWPKAHDADNESAAGQLFRKQRPIPREGQARQSQDRQT